MAKEAGTAKASNMVMLGVAAPFLDIPVEVLKNSIKEIFGQKGEKVVKINIAAFDAGLACSMEELKK
jgi:indolepyruvate ferredoxin oxidoreductase beta subunit